MLDSPLRPAADQTTPAWTGLRFFLHITLLRLPAEAAAMPILPESRKVIECDRYMIGREAASIRTTREGGKVTVPNSETLVRVERGCQDRALARRSTGST